MYATEVNNINKNKFIIHGNMHTAHHFTKNYDNKNDTTCLHINIQGNTKISNPFFIYAKWKYNFLGTLHERHENALRNNTLGIVGLQHKIFGDINYGRNTGLIGYTLSSTAVLKKIHIQTHKNSTFLTGHSGNLLTYKNSKSLGSSSKIDIALQLQGRNSFSSRREAEYEATRSGYAIALTYNYKNNYTFISSFANLKRTETHNKLSYGKGKYAQLWATSLQYKKDPFCLSLSCSKKINSEHLIQEYGFANQAISFSALAELSFFNKSLHPFISYATCKGKDIEMLGKARLHEYVVLGFTYEFTKNASIFAGYKINLLKNNQNIKLDIENMSSVGIRYTF